MRFEKHLFISYAHIDDRPLSQEQRGWVTRLHHSLFAMLSMRIGRDAEIWRDAELAGSDIFGNEIVSQFAKTAVLLSVLSPRYLESDWCKSEIREFCRAADPPGISVGNKCRIVKIFKSPVEGSDVLPSVMNATLGHQFYELETDGTPLELDPDYGVEYREKYNRRVATLAWDIVKVLKLLDGAPSTTSAADVPAPAAAPPPKATVYLAECSYDRRDAREALATELKCHGYRVLPDRPLPRDETTYRLKVDDLLSQSRLSIHLVGSIYGAVPDGPSGKSNVVLQNELAIRRSKQGGLRRIVWLPEGTTSKHHEQELFIQQMLTDPEAQWGADVICSIEPQAINGAVHAALQNLVGAGVAAPMRNARRREKLIYLICTERDRRNTILVRRSLRQHGFDVEVPLFEGDAAAVRQAHQELLMQCTGVLIFYDEGTDEWKRSVDGDLRKLRATRVDATPLPVFTYLAGPETEAKRELIEVEEPNLLNALGGFSDQSLLPFLDAFGGVDA